MVESQPKAPVGVAIGIVIDAGKVLICRRKSESHDPFAGLWEFPGGKCLENETPERCVIRELHEELNIQASPRHALAVIEHVYPTVRVRLHPFICRLESGRPEARSASEFRWVELAELGKYRFPEANGGLLEELMSGRWLEPCP